MRKVIYFIVALIMMFTFAAAENSPTLMDLYSVDPDMNFHVAEGDDEWDMIYDLVREKFDFDILFEDDYYGTYEIISVEVPDGCDRMVWTFPYLFNYDQLIRVVFCSMDMTTVVIWNAEQDDELEVVVMAGEALEENSYYMLVFASDPIDF